MTDPKHKLVEDNLWMTLRRFTAARIALGRAGVSLPTEPHLQFQLAHAQARDSVHLEFDPDALLEALSCRGLPAIQLHSQAPDRAAYLQRPDWGRRLSDQSRAALQTQLGEGCDLLFVIADGLSPAGIHQHSIDLLDACLERMRNDNWRVGPVVVVEQGRVAVGDEIGELLRAKMLVMIIGERPGLSSPDSIGVYFTYAPRKGRKDAERNCISNIRPQGLSFERAANTLHFLLTEAWQRGYSGVGLKDLSGEQQSAIEGEPQRRCFLAD